MATESAGMTTAGALHDTPPRTGVAGAMAAAALAWLSSLEPDQRAQAHWGPPEDEESEAERLRWYYTPTDHGGLPLGRQGPAQQSLAMQLLATGLSTAGYVTVCTVIGLENVLDQVEGFSVDWGRERGRDPGMYFLRVFGDPGPSGAWGWRFGGHHVSVNNLVVDGRVVATTPCFVGSDPASAPLLGGASLRPLGTAEDLARELMRSLPANLASRATLLDRAPSDIIGGNRTRLTEGDEMILLDRLFRGRFVEPHLVDRIIRMTDGAEAASGFNGTDHRQLALTGQPKGLPATALDDAQREVLTALLTAYQGRVPDGLAPAVPLDAVHFAWAGSTRPGEPHYYRLQGPRLLVEWDNTQRAANHAHSVWRDPETDFGLDVLARHRAAHHKGGTAPRR
jgi:hypothetical protein